MEQKRSFLDKIKGIFISTENKQSGLQTLIKHKGFEGASASVIAAFLGLVVGLVVMLVANPTFAFAGFSKLLAGGLTGGSRGVGNVVYGAIPIILTGLSVGFAFKTGLFNIGASGQYTMGMFFSLLTAHVLNGNWVMCLIAGMIGGLLWGAIPGIFKALLNVNEVITSIMTNYIGMYLVDMLILDVPKIKSALYEVDYGRTYVLPDSANLPKLGMDKLFPRSNANAGFFIAIAIAIIIWFVLNKTKFGFELKACGMNKDSARYAGVNEKRTIVLSMVIAGALSGIGGALQIQAGAGNFYSPTNLLAVNGFNGIAVALLGVSNPIGIIFAGLFFSHLQQGGLYLQALGMTADIIDIIIGVIIYFSAFALIIRSYIPRIIKFFKQKFKKSEQKDNENMIEETKEDA